MNNEVSICPACGRKITEYKHTINKTLVAGLARLNAMGGRARIDRLGLDYTQFTNFQKLRYFGLAIPTNEHSEWQITDQGIWFLQGRIQISRFVITRNATIVRKSTEVVFINEVKDCVDYKVEWKAQARQPNLYLPLAS